MSSTNVYIIVEDSTNIDIKVIGAYNNFYTAAKDCKKDQVIKGPFPLITSKDNIEISDNIEIINKVDSKVDLCQSFVSHEIIGSVQTNLSNSIQNDFSCSFPNDFSCSIPNKNIFDCFPLFEDEKIDSYILPPLPS